MFGRKKNRHSFANTIVGIDTKVNGDMHFTGGLHVDGIVHGNVSADPDSESSVSLADGATIDGGVTVPYVLLEGIVKVTFSPTSASFSVRPRGSSAMCITI